MSYNACMVAFPSLLYSRRSERVVMLSVVTRGPPPLPVQSMYSWTTMVSKIARLVSKFDPPFVLFGVTTEFGTTSGNPPCDSVN
jgi:hypothetical protein